MRRLLHLLAAAPLLFAAAACSNDDPPVTADGQATWVVPSGAASEPTIPSNRTSQPGASAEGSGTGATATQGGATRCRTKDLKAATGAAESIAGVLYVNLVFTNKSAKPCTLSGYPTVSWVSAKTGKLINKPFAPSAGEALPTVTVPSKQSAHATLAYHHPGEVDPTKCKSVAVKGYRVTPPQETTSIFVKGVTTACSSSGTNTGKVLAIATGSK
ncbi:DUF4232 domain-containing protein [Actinoplanes sp. NPDC051513]|uniref:DUF4232 domain-containing protein n=1 Tax=Actinoplanes sp. NPDC051513 TaxID=3363908 RepID=UPI0037A30E75